MKTAREELDIINGNEETGSMRAAASLPRVSHDFRGPVRFGAWQATTSMELG